MAASSSSTSAFRLLSLGGSNFNDKRFQKDHSLFEGNQNKNQGVSKNGRKRHHGHDDDEEDEEVSAVRGPLTGGLDFFGTTKVDSGASGKSSVKRKISQGGEGAGASAGAGKRKRHIEDEARESDSDSDDEDANADSDSDSDSDSDHHTAVAPPVQKIKITGPSPLPVSFTSMTSLLSSVNGDMSASASQISTLKKNLEMDGVTQIWGVQGAVAGAMIGGSVGNGKSKDNMNMNTNTTKRDVMVVAPTGSGKTLSYLLPLFLLLGKPSRSFRSSHSDEQSAPAQESATTLTPTPKGIRSLILVPTHELALQTRNEVLKLARGGKWRVILLDKATEKAVVDTVQASESKNEGDVEEVEGEDKDKISTAQPAIDFLIATPERLHHLVESSKISLSSVRHLILDEADRLVGHDFLSQTEPIVQSCTHPSVQKVLLSATIEAGPEAIARTWLRSSGTRIVVGIKDAATTTIDQKLLFCGSEGGKLMALRNDIAAGALPPPTLIFVQSIERANDLYRELVMDGVQVGVVHGERSKAKRTEAVEDFRMGKIWMLVVTDVMSRGLDFKGVQVVVNYGEYRTVKTESLAIRPDYRWEDGLL